MTTVRLGADLGFRNPDPPNLYAAASKNARSPTDDLRPLFAGCLIIDRHVHDQNLMGGATVHSDMPQLDLTSFRREWKKSIDHAVSFRLPSRGHPSSTDTLARRTR